jgi:Mn2+/Fe2+ NRAMP family transporter
MPAPYIVWIFGLFAGISLGLVILISHKIEWYKFILLGIIWGIAFSQIDRFWIFLVIGVIACFLTLLILGRLEPRNKAVNQNIEEQ